MPKRILICAHNGILLSKKKEWNTTGCSCVKDIKNIILSKSWTQNNIVPFICSSRTGKLIHGDKKSKQGLWLEGDMGDFFLESKKCSVT